jgi:hypothetical protein
LGVLDQGFAVFVFGVHGVGEPKARVLVLRDKTKLGANPVGRRRQFGRPIFCILEAIVLAEALEK